MAARRSNRSNSSRSNSRSRSHGRSSSRSANKGGNKAAPAIIALIVLGGIVLGFSLLGKNKTTPQKQDSMEGPSKAENNAPSMKGNASEYASQNRPKHKPPTLSREESLECDRLYEQAKQSWNEALKIKNSDRSQFVAKRKLAETLIEQLMEKVRPILDWEEEATMNDWPIPYEVNDLMRRFHKWSKLQATVHRMSSLKK
jgi:hypothetical protein